MSEEHQTTFDRLFSLLNKPVEEIEATRQRHHRESLSFTNFVKLLVYYFTQGIGSGRLLITDLKQNGPELKLPQVSRSTFFDAFTRFPTEWFAQLASRLLKEATWLEIPELKSLGTLYSVDGSLFPALMEMDWATYKTGCQAFRLHLLLDLNHMLPVHIVIGDGNSNEKTVLKELLEANITYITDRGYVCFDLLAAIVKAKAYFVMRMKRNLSYTTLEKRPVSLPQSVTHFFCHLTDQKVTLKKAKGHTSYRLISFWIDQTQFLILTNRFDLTTFQIIMIYGYRWQIELIFRFLKRTCNGLHLLSTSEKGVTTQFYALIITALLQLHLKQTCILACENSEPLEQTPFDDQAIADRFASVANGQPFLATVGDKLHRFWKIGIHWLHTLRNCLAKPFDLNVIKALGYT